MSELHLKGALDLAGDLALGGVVFADGKKILVLPSADFHSEKADLVRVIASANTTVRIGEKFVVVEGGICTQEKQPPLPGTVVGNGGGIKIKGMSVSVVHDKALVGGSPVELTHSGQ